jgi:hypothetical protein
MTDFSLMPVLAAIAVPAQIMVEGDEEYGPMWQLHARPDVASPKSWAWVIAVRGGEGNRLLQFHGTEIWANFMASCHDNKAFRPRMEATCGPDIYDLVAYSPDFMRCFGRFLGHSTVLGYPQRPEYGDDKPIRVFREIKAWLRGRCSGVVLIGTDDENLEWLRGCENGIVADDVAHGQMIHKRLKRAYEGPRVLVAQ